MLATLASAAAAPPLAPPGAADAPTLDLYVGEERRTTITTTNFGTASRGVAAICPICAAGDLGVDVAKPMHYALRPEAAIRAGGSKQRRNHHAQSLRRAWRMVPRLLDGVEVDECDTQLFSG